MSSVTDGRTISTLSFVATCKDESRLLWPLAVARQDTGFFCSKWHDARTHHVHADEARAVIDRCLERLQRLICCTRVDKFQIGTRPRKCELTCVAAADAACCSGTPFMYITGARHDSRAVAPGKVHVEPLHQQTRSQWRVRLRERCECSCAVHWCSSVTLRRTEQLGFMRLAWPTHPAAITTGLTLLASTAAAHTAASVSRVSRSAQPLRRMASSPPCLKLHVKQTRHKADNQKQPLLIPCRGRQQSWVVAVRADYFRG